ncbi:hypothetical protein [Laribacter hongkongensis]|uniref:hypothetical protein n=1 Tax=Laribacter hongkongensis TaxID=168471 RepID=UPI00117E1DC8|nr:hypothetical protein [Laribacter hongkongensis]
MQALLEHLYMAGHNPAMETQRQEIEDRIRAIDAQRIDCEARKQNLLNAIEVGAITIADVASRLDKIRAEDVRLNDEHESLKLELASSGSNNSWVVEAVEEEMHTVEHCIVDVNAIDQRAEFRIRLQGAIEVINVFHDHAILKLRRVAVPSFIALTDAISIESERKPVWIDESSK